MALEGTLHDMTLVDLFDIFRLSDKSGILRLFSFGKESAVYVTMGRLIDATVHDAITRQLLLRGDDAVLQMLQWDAAEFTFTYDRSIVRHPVTIFQESEQLVRLSAAPPPPSPHATPIPHMAMPISANLAFLYDLAPAGDTIDRQIYQSYRRHTNFSSDQYSSVPPQPSAGQVYRFDLVPLANVVPQVAPAAPATPAPSVVALAAPTTLAPSVLDERTVGEKCATVQVSQAQRTVASSAGRKLLAAVMRHIRAL